MSFPTDRDLIAYVERENNERSTPVTRRDIARAFGIKGEARTRLRQTLKRLDESGELRLYEVEGVSEVEEATRIGYLPPPVSR